MCCGFSIVYTNKHLYEIKLSDTSLCTFSEEYEESLEHLSTQQKLLDANYFLVE